MDKMIYDIIVNRLGKSRQTATNWIQDNSYPAEACLLIEQVTEGEITTQSLRPDLFVPTTAQRKLCDTVGTLLNEDDATLILTAVLNYFSKEQPDLYDELHDMLYETPQGLAYLKKRKVYTDDEL